MNPSVHPIAIHIVAGSRCSDAEFQHTLLGESLARLAFAANFRCHVTTNNYGDHPRGLAEIYNAYIDRQFADDLVVFVHDDVFLDDRFLIWRLSEALALYDVVGVAGNRQAEQDDVSWYFELRADGRQLIKYPDERLSGSVTHISDQKAPRLTYYGQMPADCERLDGCFIAARVGPLLAAGVRFDEQFRFHFYDLDFTRQCAEAGLRMGTWPIAITHKSSGHFGSDAWRAGCRNYARKWHTPESPAHRL